MSFYIGDCSPSSVIASDIKYVSDIRDARDLRDGDVVSFLGHIGRWDTHDCVSEEICISYVLSHKIDICMLILSPRWRKRGDPLCDAALETIFPNAKTSVGKDLLSALEEYVSANPDPNPASAFLDEVSRPPPSNLQATEDEIETAQAFFLDYAIQIMQALLHYSLAAGFSR